MATKKSEAVARIIPHPDKQLGFEISLAVQNYYRRKKL